MGTFDFTSTKKHDETQEQVEEVQSKKSPEQSQGSETQVSSGGMIEAIEIERNNALSQERERHEQIKITINAKFDELKRIEEERERTITKAVQKAEENLREIDTLISERRSGIFEEVNQIAQEFNERFVANS